MGEGRENPIGTQPSTGEAAEKGFALFERSEFAKPRQHRGAQGIPPSAGQGTRVPFLWFVSLGKQRNEHIISCCIPRKFRRNQKKE
jgi:hypothetical protein